MKRPLKSLTLILVLLILFSALTGCEKVPPVQAIHVTQPSTGSTTVPGTADPLASPGVTVEIPPNGIQIMSGSESITPLCCFLWRDIYDAGSGSWNSGSGGGAYNAMTDPNQPLPELRLQASVGVDMPSDCSMMCIEVYDRQFREVELCGQNLNALSELPCGTWYVVLTIIWQGNYIPQEQAYEKTCSEYLFLLTVPDETHT